jgi:hypothetical protein
LSAFSEVTSDELAPTKDSVEWFALGDFRLAVMVCRGSRCIARVAPVESAQVRVLGGMTPFGNTYVVNGTGDGDQVQARAWLPKL